MKTKDELNAIKSEAEALNKKLCALTEEELAQISGGGITPSTTRSWMGPPPDAVCG